jgi:hypothetical protein
MKGFLVRTESKGAPGDNAAAEQALRAEAAAEADAEQRGEADAALRHRARCEAIRELAAEFRAELERYRYMRNRFGPGLQLFSDAEDAVVGLEFLGHTLPSEPIPDMETARKRLDGVRGWLRKLQHHARAKQPDPGALPSGVIIPGLGQPGGHRRTRVITGQDSW